MTRRLVHLLVGVGLIAFGVLILATAYDCGLKGSGRYSMPWTSLVVDLLGATTAEQPWRIAIYGSYLAIICGFVFVGAAVIGFAKPVLARIFAR